MIIVWVLDIVNPMAWATYKALRATWNCKLLIWHCKFSKGRGPGG